MCLAFCFGFGSLLCGPQAMARQPGNAQRLAMGSDLDASSQYPSLGSFTTRASQPSVETDGVV